MGNDWRKATASNSQGNCVEVRPAPDGGVAVRNSRHPDGVVLTYTAGEFAAFVAGCRDGEFDDLC